MTLLNNIIELDVDRKSLNPEEIVGGIIIPFSEKHALVKTITCKVKDINEKTKAKYNLKIGDEVLVDRYAIITYNRSDLSKPFHAFIDAKNILLKKNV